MRGKPWIYVHADDNVYATPPFGHKADNQNVFDSEKAGFKYVVKVKPSDWVWDPSGSWGYFEKDMGEFKFRLKFY